RAEEGLGELRIRLLGDPRREGAADAPPERALERARAEPLAQFRDRLVHEALVEPDALDGVLLARAQVAAVEGQRRAARDGAEIRIVTGERLDGVAGALLSQGGGELVGGGHQRLAGLSRSRSAGRGSGGAGTAARSAAPARAPWTARGAPAPERRPPHRSRGSPVVLRLRGRDIELRRQHPRRELLEPEIPLAIVGVAGEGEAVLCDRLQLPGPGENPVRGGARTAHEGGAGRARRLQVADQRVAE